MKYKNSCSLLVALAFLCLSFSVSAIPMYSFGISTEVTITSGEVVFIEASLRNLGDESIVFAPSFPGGVPSVQGGSVPGAGANGGGWNILSNGFTFGPTVGLEDFYSQFEGISINPNEELDFILGSFIAPTNEALGQSAISQFNFRLSYTDNIQGTLSGISGSGFDYSGFNNTPTVNFTLGTSHSSSTKEYFTGIVVDTSNGSLLSSPNWFDVSKTNSVPEPSSLSIIILGFLLLILLNQEKLVNENA